MRVIDNTHLTLTKKSTNASSSKKHRKNNTRKRDKMRNADIRQKTGIRDIVGRRLNGDG